MITTNSHLKVNTMTTTTAIKSINASQLKALHEKFDPSSLFFDRDTMKFFGDTMSNFAVIVDTCYDWYNKIDDVPCYKLVRKSTTRKGAPSGCLRRFGLDGEMLFCVGASKENPHD
ncbi:hypothetical protein YpEc11_01 [Yersinia phage vB_YpEc11]|uniref:Uncharacterized protein n=1 Tax=Yersinia phage vB_YpEc11 TaxID=3056113 RepID=A0AA51Z359_9CAUD|nr:hypothetical protein YpEc11_01 [Yersinia phage vB_YpEc11]